jgi:hypothetical protein
MSASAPLIPLRLDTPPVLKHSKTLACGMSRRASTGLLAGITIDPRADERYVEVVQKYCKRAAFAIQPVKSSLYGDPYKQTGIIRKFVTVKKPK